MFIQRTISGAVVLLLLFLASMSVISLSVLSLAVALVGIYELYSAFKLEKSLLALVSYIFVGLYYIFLYIFNDTYILHIMALYIIVLAIVYITNYPKINLEKLIIVLFGFIYVGFLFSFVLRTKTLAGGGYLFWLVFFAAWGTDTFAYLSGMFFGKRKLAPELSPNKSIEGAIGGVIGAMSISLVYMIIVVILHKEAFTQNLALLVLCCVITVGIASIISQFGDLFASAFKRNLGIKDYGNIIPGHGGILDRFDSVLFTAPIVYIILSLI